MRNDSEKLISRLLGAGLSPTEASQLGQLLASDANLRDLYQQQMVTHALLGWRHGTAGQRELGEIDPIVIAELLHEVEQQTLREIESAAQERARLEAEAAARRREIERLERRNVPRQEPIVVPYSVVYLTAAALAASIVWAAITFFPRHGAEMAAVDPPPAAETPVAPTVATVADGTEVDLWRVEGERETPLNAVVGTPIVAGEYALKQGVVQFAFDSGVTALLEAPANIHFASTDRVRLTRGRFVGSVPPQAIGFTVHTPSGAVVDLGTEFGVAVVDSGHGAGAAADVMVFDGQVDVIASASSKGEAEDGKAGRPSRRVGIGDSVQVDPTGRFAKATTSAQLYFREVPTSQELAEKRAYERWLAFCKKLAADPDVVAFYTFNDQQPGDALLLNRAGDGQSLHGRIRGAQWSEGRWRYKQSLRFASDPHKNPTNYVQVDIPGQFEAITLASWVNIDALSSHHDGLSALLMSNGWDRPGQIHWQIEQDGRLQAGAFGGVEMNADSPIHSNTFGNWCHVAVVCSMHLRQTTFYVDGTLVGSRTTPPHEHILVGAARIGGWNPGNRNDFSDEWRTLHGRMGELLVVGRAMSSAEIKEVYEAGKP